MSGSNIKLGDFAEKSPGVHYANWKEDILLKKNLHTLGRTERNIVHRIKVDQKVLFKRFQNKLHRSRLTKARLWGDKETERELRSGNLHGLNVDIVNSEKDYEFLGKLQYRPCQVGPADRTIETKADTKEKVQPVKRKKKKVVKQLDTIIKSAFQVPSVQSTPRSRSKSFSEGITRGNKPLVVQPLPVRPSTTSGSRYDDVEVVLPDMFHLNQSRNLKSQQYEKVNQPIKKRRKKKVQVNFENERPKSCSTNAMNITTLNGADVYSPRSVTHSRKSSQDKSSRRASLFEKEDKLDITGLLLENLKSLDHDSKIKEFCDSLQVEGENDNVKADYYTMRLQAAMKEIQDYRPASVPGTPEVENKRHMGNVDVLSLTFKSLNFDFSRRDHTHFVSEDPDLAPLVYSSSDYSSDEED